MTDDELLASAFRKILQGRRPTHYVSTWEDELGGLPHIELDSTWTETDGLTRAELEAIRRAAAD